MSELDRIRSVAHKALDDLMDHIAKLSGSGTTKWGNGEYPKLLRGYMDSSMLTLIDATVARHNTAALADWLRRHESHEIAHNERGFRCESCTFAKNATMADVQDRVFLVPAAWNARPPVYYHYQCTRCFRLEVVSDAERVNCPCGGTLQLNAITGRP